MAKGVGDSYEKLSQDSMDGNVPRPAGICKDCTGMAVPFSVNSSDDARDADIALGIPSSSKAATESWFTSNRWIKDSNENFRNTFLLQVIRRFGELYGEQRLAELYAFVSSQDIEFTCLDFEMESETYVTPMFFGEISRSASNGSGFQCGAGNFVFHSSRVYFWTFTSTRWSRDEVIDPMGFRRDDFLWSNSGKYAIDKAAADLDASYKRAKEAHKRWLKVKAGAEIVFGVLSLIPAIGAVRGVFGGYRIIRYTYAAIDGALAVNAIASGSTTLITGEGIDVGEKLFESLGKLVSPKDGAERGRQVFMFINLAMLAPSAYGGARWVLRKIRKDVPVSARLDMDAVSEAERNRLKGKSVVEPLAIELRGTKSRKSFGVVDRGNDPGKTEWAIRPSLDTNAAQVSVATATGRASYAVMANTLRSQLTMLIVQASGSLRVVGKICKVVGDAGEEAMAAMMVEKMGFKANRILGYSSDPKIASRFGLSNKSGHGLDMLVMVPPPPSITVRNPIDAERHLMDGVKSTSPTKTIHFTEDTLLVIETKATLGGIKTPGFNATQRTGAGKVEDLQKKINDQRNGWSPGKMREVDPNYLAKVDAISDAIKTRNIAYVHAQVFFDHQGSMNKAVGGGTGIQLNIW